MSRKTLKGDVLGKNNFRRVLAVTGTEKEGRRAREHIDRNDTALREKLESTQADRAAWIQQASEWKREASEKDRRIETLEQFLDARETLCCVCVDCGIVKIDEDGCCTQCGSDAELNAPWREVLNPDKEAQP